MKTLINGQYFECWFYNNSKGEMFVVDDQPVDDLVICKVERGDGTMLVVAEDEIGEKLSWTVELD